MQFSFCFQDGCFQVPLENFLTAKLLPAVVAGLGLPLTFFLFAGAAGTGAVWGGTVLPETRGLSFRQVQQTVIE